MPRRRSAVAQLSTLGGFTFMSIFRFKSDSRECQIPPEALSDPKRREVLRAWIANGSLHASLFIPDEWPEPAHWGVVLSDVMRHVADAYQKQHGIAPGETIRQIQEQIGISLDSQTRDVSGDFIE